MVGFIKKKKLKEAKTKYYIYIRRKKRNNKTSNYIMDLN